MSAAAEFRSGKGYRDENFPVASWIIRPRYRAPILAFYNFVRTADDIADHPGLSEPEKLEYLERLEASLLGQSEGEREGVLLREALRTHDLPSRHAQDLLTAFRMDVTKHRYADWDDLINYCRYSAMPVGRYVLDVHGEDRATWASSDALCAALQIINHLQDCKPDYLKLDRVYVPMDALSAAGLTVAALAADRANPALRRCLQELAARTGQLLAESLPLASSVADIRLGCEIAAIQSLAQRLVRILQERDPLSERVHLRKPAMAAFGAWGATKALATRLFRSRAKSPKPSAP